MLTNSIDAFRFGRFLNKGLAASPAMENNSAAEHRGCPFASPNTTTATAGNQPAIDDRTGMALTLPPFFLHFLGTGVILYLLTPLGLWGTLAVVFLLHSLYQLNFYLSWLRAVPDHGVPWLALIRSYVLACFSGFRGIIVHNYERQRVKHLLEFPRSKTAAYTLLSRPHVEQMLPAANPVITDETNELRMAIRRSFPKDIQQAAAKRIDQMVEETNGLVTPRDLCKMHLSVLMDTVWKVDLLKIDPQIHSKYYEIIRYALLGQRVGKLRYFFGVVLYLHFNYLYPKAYRLLLQTEKVASVVMKNTDYLKRECGERRLRIYTAMLGGALLTSIGNLTGMLYEGVRLGRLPDEKQEKKDFIDELLRVYSSIPYMGRDVKGIHTFIALMPVYEDNGFNHRRFSDEDRASADKAGTYAFGIGNRQCPAMGFIYKTVYSQYMSHLSDNYTISLANQSARLANGRAASLAFSDVAFRIRRKTA